jgi:riboflavin-specific deaminase-like protein
MNKSAHRPRVTLKIAQTLDGRIATRTGHSRWVSSPASRSMGHALRASHDAILVGIGTVLTDDPQLTVRLAAGRNPMRVVIDSSLRVPLNAAVLASDGIAVKIVTHAPASAAAADAIRALGAEVVAVPGSKGRVDLAIALQELRVRGIESVLVEGGAKIATEMIRLQLVDELVLFIASKVIGTGVDAIGDLGIVDMTEAVQFSSSSVELLEGDIVFRGRLAWPY